MPQKQKPVGLILCFIFIMFIQALLVQPIYADVEEVKTDGQSIHKTDPSDGEGESVGGGGEDIPWWERAWNKAKEIGSDGLELINDIGNSIGEGWNEFLDSAGEFWDGVQEWYPGFRDNIRDTLNDIGTAIGGFFSDAWDWIQENEWFQTIVAGVLATVVIVVGAFVILGTWPALAVIAVIGGLALGAGFLYQWLAGDDYNFFGAFGSALAGGLVGYLGMTTGAFAAAWTWLSRTAAPAAWHWIRNTAVPWVVGRGQAAWSWIRNTAVPWIAGKGQAAWGWMRTVAFPWLQGRALAGWNWFKGLPVWGQIRAGYTSGPILSILKTMAQGAGVSGFASMSINIVAQLLGGDAFSFKELFISTGLGALTGALVAPILIPGLVLSGSLITTLSLFSGVENWISGGLTDGEWSSWQNFVSGTLTAFISIGAISKLTELIPNPFASEIVTKGAEEPVKNWIDDLLDGSNSGNKEPIPEPSEPPAVEQPVETPTQPPVETPTPQPTQQPVEAPTPQPTQQPVETPTQQPVDTPTEQPTLQPADTPNQQPVETPTQQSTETPAQPPETPTQQPADSPTGEQPPSQDATGSTDTTTSNHNTNRIHRGINPQPVQ